MLSLQRTVHEYYLPLIKLFTVNNNDLPLIKILTVNDNLLLIKTFKVNRIITVNDNY